MKRQSDRNPYPDGWRPTGAMARLEKFIEDELVLPWYVRRRLLAMVRAADREPPQEGETK